MQALGVLRVLHPADFMYECIMAQDALCLIGPICDVAYMVPALGACPSLHALRVTHIRLAWSEQKGTTKAPVLGRNSVWLAAQL